MEEKNILKKERLNKYLEMLPNFKEKKAQAFTTLTFTLIALSIFGFFAINPTLSTIAKLKKELADSEFVNKSLEKKILNLSTLKQKYDLLTNDLPVILDALPQTPTVPLLVGQIQSLTQTFNLVIIRLQVSQVELSNLQKSDKPSSFTFSLETQGSYADLSNFLSSLTNFERIVTIDAVSIAKKGTKTLLQLNLRGRAYFKG